MSAKPSELPRFVPFNFGEGHNNPKFDIPTIKIDQGGGMTTLNIRPWHIVNGHEFLIETKHQVVMVVVFNGFNLIFSSKNDGELLF